jgi:hypothetical protein
VHRLGARLHDRKTIKSRGGELHPYKPYFNF